MKKMTKKEKLLGLCRLYMTISQFFPQVIEEDEALADNLHLFEIYTQMVSLKITLQRSGLWQNAPVNSNLKLKYKETSLRGIKILKGVFDYVFIITDAPDEEIIKQLKLGTLDHDDPFEYLKSIGFSVFQIGSFDTDYQHTIITKMTDAVFDWYDYTDQDTDNNVDNQTNDDTSSASVITEAVEICPYCEGENIFPNWDVNTQGYIVKCQHCGEKMLLCDECLHADDNPAAKCDYELIDDPYNHGCTTCFRAIQTEIMQKMNPVENDELDTYMDFLEHGITVDVMRDLLGDGAAEHMEMFCKEHGLI